MPTFERGDIVAVPLPYVDYPVLERRPALVVANALGPNGALIWVLMITSARNQRWAGDVPITTNVQTTKLRAPSVIRTAKIATVEARAAQLIGRINNHDRHDVNARLSSELGLTPP